MRETNFNKYFNYGLAIVLFGISYLFFTEPVDEIKCCAFWGVLVLFGIWVEIIKNRKE